MYTSTNQPAYRRQATANTADNVAYNARAMTREKTRSLRQLLLTHEIAFLLLVIVAGAVGGASAFFWQRSSVETIRLNDLAYGAQEIRSDAFRQLNEVALAKLREDPQADELFMEFTRSIKERFNHLRQISESRDEAYSIQALQKNYVELRGEMSKVFDDSLLLNRVVRSRLIDPAYMDNMTNGFESAFKNFRGLLNQKLQEQHTKTARWSRLAPYVIPIPVIIAIALLVFSRFSLHKGFVKPIRNMVAGLEQLRGGVRTARIDESQGVGEIVAVAESINNLNGALLASQDALVEKERQAALGSLVPVVAHNIRNPLASIRASVQVLDIGDSESELEETKLGIIDTVDRLGRWVNALVSYLHPLTPQYRSHKISALFDATERLLADRIAQQQIALDRDPWDDEITVPIDADLMEQAIYALLSNAIEASKKGQAITLGIEAANKKIIVTIKDEAGGIPFQPEPKELEPGP
ncbi:MAG: histidine kinase dimerization/phospho-acceptor domain-containing protein, partial [Pseudomonadota bacterium]